MAEDRMKVLEDRLSRLEATLNQRLGGTAGTGGGGVTFPGGGISDPPPFATGAWTFIPRPIPSPVVDPAPWPYGGAYGGPYGGWTRPRWPTPVVDPVPFPTTIVDPAPWPNPVVDPASFAQASLAAALGRIRSTGGDPPPPDLSRLSAQQLEATIHSISAERARLDAMEAMVKKQIETLKKQQPG